MQKDAAEVATYEDKIQQALKNSVAEDPEVIRLRAKVTQLDDLLAKLRREKPILERKVRDAEEALKRKCRIASRISSRSRPTG
jgi:predicted  nucleic acid-binding Zn-ribbon protein